MAKEGTWLRSARVPLNYLGLYDSIGEVILLCYHDELASSPGQMVTCR